LSIEKVINKLESYIYDSKIYKYVKVLHIPNKDSDYLSKFLKTENNKDIIKIEIDCEEEYIASLIPLKFIEIILNIVKSSGWYSALIELWNFNKKDVTKNVEEFIKNIKNYKINKLVFICERYFPVEGSFIINTILYHLTTMDKLTNIKKTGLSPKNSDIKIAHHPERIYFCKNLNCIIKFIKELEDKNIELGPYALLSINPAKIFYDTFNGKKEQIYFFNDIRKDESIYTNFNIHPNNIKILQEDITTSEDVKLIL
jgi:hypothetical protein